MELNNEQLEGISRVKEFLKPSNESREFVFEGAAGTGKTTCVKHAVEGFRGRVCFTAPTNKATRVLKQSLTTKDYTPECCTIYSLLGLRMEPSGEFKVLSGLQKEWSIEHYDLVIVDEAFMINSQLDRYIQDIMTTCETKLIYLGDRCQLPPVGEKDSPIVHKENGAKLVKVMRHDNQILTLATRVRKASQHPAPSIELSEDHNGVEGVWMPSLTNFEMRIANLADCGEFSKPTAAKVIAWRNVTVDSYNKLIRKALFDDSGSKWLPTDRIVLTEPIKDFRNKGKFIASTDDEGQIQEINVIQHPLYPEFRTWALSVILDDNRKITVYDIHGDSCDKFMKECQDLMSAARANHKMWGKYWNLREAFNGVKHAYAITTHRAQGSTYDKAFVCYRDILANQNRQEAFRCLYTAITRPKHQLWLA